MVKLVEKGFSVDRFECIKDVEGYMREEFSIAEAKDVSQFVLPYTARGEWARHYFSHPTLAKAINRCLPFDMVKNTLVGSLLPISIRREIACYHIHILKNNK